MIKRFISYYKPHIKLFTMDMLASLFVSLIAVVYPVVTRKMLNDLIPNRNYKMVIAAGLVLLGLYLVRMLLNYFIQYQGHIMGVRMQAQMRSDMFKHLQKLPFSFYDGHETGKIMSRITNDLMDISVVLSFVYLMTINAYLTLIIFACVPLLAAAAIFTRTKMQRAFRKSKQAVADINGAIQSSISGIRVTKAFTNSEKEIEKFETGNEEFKEASRDAYKAMGQFHSVTTFITDIFNVIVLIAGGLFLYRGKIDFADYSAFIVSVNLFLSPVNTLIRFMEQFQNGAAGFERFVEIMDMPEEQDTPGAENFDRLEGNIEFSDVSYGYGEQDDVLKHVNMKIEKGETFALVGPSGGGKTTICHLIPHFYDVQSGKIFIDGHEIHSITMDTLRKNVGIVQQDVYLFNASIKDNILYGRLDATDEEVYEAAKKANIHDYIMSMEEGYDTVIGERGVRLSGGQKQRLCIARVFLKNPPILILDEATSALDNATEMMIQKSLDDLRIGRTTLVVAHRLSTIKNADEIAVVSDGKIIEQGTHSQLFELGGVYAGLYNQQFSEINR